MSPVLACENVKAMKVCSSRAGWGRTCVWCSSGSSEGECMKLSDVFMISHIGGAWAWGRQETHTHGVGTLSSTNSDGRRHGTGAVASQVESLRGCEAWPLNGMSCHVRRHTNRIILSQHFDADHTGAGRKREREAREGPRCAADNSESRKDHEDLRWRSGSPPSSISGRREATHTSNKILNEGETQEVFSPLSRQAGRPHCR